MNWFGPCWHAALCHDKPPIDRPLLPCAWCEEVFTPEDSGIQIPSLDGPPAPFHRACWLRQMVGSVAHLERRCGCYVPGATELDPPHLSKRAAAEAAAIYYEAIGARRG